MEKPPLKTDGIGTMGEVIIDLWSGTGSATAAFRELTNARIITVDINPEFNPTICIDILDLTVEMLRAEIGEDQVVFIWASPDCSVFSVANFHAGHFHPDTREAQTDKAKEMIKRVKHTLQLIDEIDPPTWVLENPRGLLRKMPWMRGIPRHTVTYCQYGDDRMKPTDLFGFPPVLFPVMACKNGDPCHEASPRSAPDAGTQGRSRKDRALIPYGLSVAMLMSLRTRNHRALTLWDYSSGVRTQGQKHLEEE